MGNSFFRSLKSSSFWIFVPIAVVAIALIVWAFWSTGGRPFSASPSRPGVVANVDPKALPSRFPADLPFFNKAIVEQNFNVDHGSTIEATQKYLSTLPMETVFTNYQKYFLSTGWDLTSMKRNGTSSIEFFGNKRTTQLSVFLNLEPKYRRLTEVTLSFTYPK